MEKKLLSNPDEHQVQPYTLRAFDEPPAAEEEIPAAEYEDAPVEEQISEEERLRNIEQEARKRGFEQGHAEGYAGGLQEGKNEIDATIGRLGQIMASIDRFRETRLAELLPEIIDLSLEIAKKVVHKEIELDRNLIFKIAGDAIAKGGGDEGIVIKINPLDYEVMISHIDHLKEQSGLKKITIEPSDSISPGGCFIETPTGEVDARYEEQVKEIEDAITTATHRKM